MRSKPVLVEQRENVVVDLVLGLGEQVGLRKGGLRNAGTGILAAELGDDVVEVLFRTEALPFEHFHNRGNFLHVGDGRFLDGHGVTFGTLVVYLPFGFHSRASCCASAIWSEVICLASASRSLSAISSPLTPARLYHL